MKLINTEWERRFARNLKRKRENADKAHKH